MELVGTITQLMPERSGTSARGDWKSQNFVLQFLDGEYLKHVVFSVFGADRLEKFKMQVNQHVRVSFDIDAREYQGKWYNDLKAYDVRLEADNAAPGTDAQAAAEMPPQATQMPPQAAPAMPPAFAPAAKDNDDLPF